VFGDSLSAGYNIAQDESWVALLQQTLREDHPQYNIVNTSISGETTAGGVRRIAGALQRHQPTLIIIELGANDGLRGLPLITMKKNLANIITQSHESGADVLLVGMKLPPNYGVAYTKKFRHVYAELAKRYDITLIPFLLEGLTTQDFQADDLHPTAAAQAHIMHNVLQTLTPLLKNP